MAGYCPKMNICQGSHILPKLTKHFHIGTFYQNGFVAFAINYFNKE
jgi:hypothetical protein